MAFFKEHGLDLLASTLEHDMRQLPSANDVADAQAPFKIFLSLLDKWEIGEWLSDRLAIPSLEASRETAVAGHQDEVSCISRQKKLTAGSRNGIGGVRGYRAQRVVEAPLQGPGGGHGEGSTDGKLRFHHVINAQHIKLVLWLLTAIPQHDEETITVHVPLMAARILRGVVSFRIIGRRADNRMRRRTRMSWRPH